jgi:hypothetical protein
MGYLTIFLSNFYDLLGITCFETKLVVGFELIQHIESKGL